jgi:hypothetical protein
VEEFEIKRGSLLSPETRMAIPDMSYEQELVAAPVPFENRVAYLSEYSKLAPVPVTLESLVNDLDLPKSFVRTMVKELDAEESKEGEEALILKPFTKEVLIEELVWQEQVEELEEYVSAITIAKMLSRQAEQIKILANGLAVFPKIVVNGKRQSLLYPKSLATQLRTYYFHLPPAADWYGIREAIEYVGKSNDWIVAQVALNGLRQGLRVSGSNVLSPHYPQDTMDALRRIKGELPKAAGDWVTAHRLVHMTGIDKDWVHARLQQYTHLSENRVADNGLVRPHYPAEVVVAIQKQYNERPEEANGWLTATAIHKKVGLGKTRVRSLLASESRESEQRQTNTGKSEKHYHPEILDDARRVLTELAPPAGGWLTLPQIASMLMKPRSWVVRKLSELDVSSEQRRDSMNRSNTHYPPNVIDEIQRRYLIQEENERSN